MPEHGITEEGISTPSYAEILDYIAARWRAQFGAEADLSSRSIEGQLFRVLAEQISNKGLGWSEIESLWQLLEDVYYSAYISTANGASLDHLVSYRGLERDPAQSASGVLVFEGEQGQEVERGTQASTVEGTIFETTRNAVVTHHGVVDVPAVCETEGDIGNVIPEIITQCNSYDVSNINDKHTFNFGSIQDTWEEIPNNESTTQYQMVEIENIKYATSVDEFKLPVRATSEGLYALRLSLLDHVSGNVLFRTETKEKKLNAGEEWTFEFVGEDFDLRSAVVGEQIRIAPVNLAYSIDNLEIALEFDKGATAWFHGSANQHASLNMSITSKVQGAFTGGMDQESDPELRSRYLTELHKGGSARPSAIKAELYDIPSVKHAEVLENNTPTDFRPDGLPPSSIEVVVWGGSQDDILQVLQNSRSAGVNTWGNHIGVIEDDYGQVHEYRYSRATEIETYIDITIITGKNFPANGAEKIKNTCARVVGGEDLKGAFHAGLVGVGSTLYQSELETELHNNVQGLKSVKTLIGTASDDKSDSNLSFESQQTPVTKPDNIFISKE